MNTRNIAVLFAVLIAVAGCGGGGGTSPAAKPSLPAMPAPTVTLALSQSKVSLGKTSTITWSSTNATSCTASGAWSGTQAISGTSLQTPIAPGANTYTLTCTGDGGTTIQTAALMVPIPVLKSSYENKIAAISAIGPQTLPTLPAGESVTSGFAFGDFFQDGIYSMVAFSNNFSHKDAGGTFDLPGKVHFFQKINGVWIDKTSTLIADQTGCIAPRKVIVADFNGDGKPDVFAACHGYDGPPYPGEQSHVLLSQLDGSYKNTTVLTDCFCHGASAADADGDGNVDIVVADMRGQGGKTPVYILMNDGHGNFTVDYERVHRKEFEYSQTFWSTEFISNAANGYNLFLGGTEPYTNLSGIPSPGTNTVFLQPDAYGQYVNTTSIAIKNSPTAPIVLDFVIDGNSLFVNRTFADPMYGGTEIQKIDMTTGGAVTLYSNLGNWIDWISINGANLVSINSAFGLSIKK